MVKPTDPKGYMPGDSDPALTGATGSRPADRPISDRPLEGVTPPVSEHYEGRAESYARPFAQRRDRYEPEPALGPRMHHQAATARISWGALFAGLVTAVVMQILFTTLGMAIGLSTLAADPNLNRSVGIGAGIWWLITGLISLFAAGWVAARVAGIPDREDACIHGFVTWGLATLFGAFMVTSTVGTLVGGTMGMLNRQLSAVAPQIAPQIAPQAAQALQQQLGINTQGNPNLDQGDVFPPQPRQPGQIQNQQRPTINQQQVEQATERTAEVTAPALWITFLALLLGACACVGGAVLGTPKTTTAVAIGT